MLAMTSQRSLSIGRSSRTGRVPAVWVIAAATGLCLAACASPPAPEADSHPHQHRLIGDANVVTIEEAGDLEHAAPIADHYCAMYGKKAQFKSTAKHHLGRYAKVVDVQFDCIAPN